MDLRWSVMGKGIHCAPRARLERGRGSTSNLPMGDLGQPPMANMPWEFHIVDDPAINAFAILLFAPLFAWMWAALARRGREPSTPAKMVLGLVLLGLGFAFLAIGGRISDGGVRVSPVWLLGAYTLHTWGELCLSPVGLSYVTKVAPARFASLLMAAWFLANSAGNKIAGSAAAQSASMPSGTFFSIFVVSSLGAAALLFFLVPVINRLSTSDPRPAPLATMTLAEES